MIPLLLQGLATDSCCSQVTQAVGELGRDSSLSRASRVGTSLSLNGCDNTWLGEWSWNDLDLLASMGLDIYIYIFRIAFIWIVLMKFLILYDRCLCAQVNREVIHISLQVQDFEAHLSSTVLNTRLQTLAETSPNSLCNYAFTTCRLSDLHGPNPLRHWAEEAMAFPAVALLTSLGDTLRCTRLKFLMLQICTRYFEHVWT